MYMAISNKLSRSWSKSLENFIVARLGGYSLIQYPAILAYMPVLYSYVSSLQPFHNIIESYEIIANGTLLLHQVG